MTDLASLTRLCPPPSPTMTIRWDLVEAELGMALPRDYKELAERYGPGRFYDYLSVFHPHGVTEFVHLTGPVPSRVRAHLRKDYDEGTFPVPCDPDQLFAIGSTDNGEYIFWITTPADDPDGWRIAVNEARGPRWFTYDGNLTAFLVSVLSGQTQVPQFPDDLLDEPRDFIPSHPTLWKPEPITSQGPVDTAAIRTWARAHGYDVPSRGRIPLEVREAWDEANRS
ncbi:Lsr2 family DNA-binding protein [Streptomyces sp. NBC_00259]|uniref:Lsr2 family DNA-binding protein n=1 Tax=Streptomyces sp. NBC_00259 TaxID=2903643 RepID=UPI002E289564|nr:histone-like nucleoid-structuring protein Lsr2 [Streptomyces sp. NBC_00259]